MDANARCGGSGGGSGGGGGGGGGRYSELERLALLVGTLAFWLLQYYRMLQKVLDLFLAVLALLFNLNNRIVP